MDDDAVALLQVMMEVVTGRVDTASDYGDEIAWDDDEVETQLDFIEAEASATVATSSAPIRTGDAQIEVQMEGHEGNLDGVNDVLSHPDHRAALAGALDVLRGANEAPDARSLWERYRRKRGWGALSVTDLVGPSWCEFQHAYRLESKPHLPPSERPTEIVSSSGATISVDRRRTVAREKILDGGKAVHLKIENEVMGDVEPVKVDVTGKEEWWALRVLNTIVCLEMLTATGRTREIPVMGFVGDFLVFGVIDEVARREIKPPSSDPHATTSKIAQRTPTKRRASGARSKKTETVELDTSQRKLDAFFTPPSSKAAASTSPSVESNSTGARASPNASDSNPPTSRWGYILSDTKTRKSPTLPYESESRASRLQVMLYHRLLTSLLLPSASDPLPLPPSSSSSASLRPFDWPRLYAHLRLEPEIPLSEAFLLSIEPIITSLSVHHSYSPKTLSDVVGGLQAYGALMAATIEKGLLEEEMEISYVMREKGRRWKRKQRPDRPTDEADLAKAIAESLRDRKGFVVETITEADEEEELARAAEMSSQEAREDADEAKAGDGAMDEGEDSQITSRHELPVLPDVSLLTSPLPSISLGKVEKDLSTSPDYMDVDGGMPVNSQAKETTSVAPVLEVEAGPRYNLRRRQRASGVIMTEAVDVRASPSSSPPAAQSEIRKEEKKPHSACTPPLSALSKLADEDEEEAVDEGALIGTQRFKNDPSELDHWLLEVIGYWDGTRAPKGVSIEQTNRCRNCEFEDGCEWLKLKSDEVTATQRERRLKREENAAIALE